MEKPCVEYFTEKPNNDAFRLQQSISSFTAMFLTLSKDQHSVVRTFATNFLSIYKMTLEKGVPFPLLRGY
jgi:hypothetical protein